MSGGYHEEEDEPNHGVLEERDLSEFQVNQQGEIVADETSDVNDDGDGARTIYEGMERE